MPGVTFNNRNWPHVLRVLRLWCTLGLAAAPAVYLLLRTLLPENSPLYIFLFLEMLGLLLPLVVTARRHESSQDAPKSPHTPRKILCMLAGLVLILLLMGTVPAGGISRGSGVRMGWTGTQTPHSWSAQYAYHNGWRERTIRTEDPNTTLHMELLSHAGTFQLTLTDEENHIFFDEKFTGSTVLDIPLSGKTRVRITGEQHQGSYKMTW